MSEVELNEAFLAKIAGWEAMKAARHILASGKVLSSNFTPPLLKGVVQEGATSYRSGLVLKSGIDLENICTCRPSREWGTICAHSVAVGLHHLRPPAETKLPDRPQPAAVAASPERKITRLRRAAPDEAGAETLELFLILPPNFPEALAKGKVMLVFEGKWSRGRMPLNSIPRDRPFKLDGTDDALLRAIEDVAGEPPGVAVLTTNEFSRVLKGAEGHPRVSLGKSTSIEVSAQPWAPALKATLEANGEVTLAVKPQEPVLLLDGWVFSGTKFQRLGVSKSLLPALRGAIKLSRNEVPAFLNNEFPRLHAEGQIDANFSPEEFSVAPEPPEIILNLSGGLAQLAAQLQFRYGTRVLPAGAAASESPWMPDPADVRRYALRDFATEQQAMSRLLRAGFGPDAQGRLQLNGNDRVLTFFAREYPRLQKEWTVTLEERLDRSTKEKLERIEPRFEITSSGVQWFDFGVSFNSSSGEQFSSADIQRLLLSGQSHTRLRNGKVAVIDTGAVEELQQFLLDAAPTQQSGKYRLGNVQAGFLEATLNEQGWQAQAPSAWRERARNQAGAASLPMPPLGRLQDVLRPYQAQGAAWMWFLRENGFGGILADEMGLGKTLQTLALLRAVKIEGSERKPTLVICPTSLVYNWVAEAEKFTPELKVTALHGASRHKLFADVTSSDVVVTSYALIRRDWERYAGLEFDTVILDEAQHIKNRATQNAQAVKALRSRHRLVLTGTPLENSVLDLWSMFDFLMPGYLGSAKDFKERYEVPIVRERNADAQARLSRRLKPFILRRLKRDVASDLPPKIEQVSFCDLTDEQRAVYQQVMEAGRKEVLEAVGEQGFAKSRMVIFNALLRLRQICCDLRLLKLEGTPADAPSGKLEAFEELLQESIDGGHRVLVFSQFVSMLSILKEKLKELEIDYAYLDGSTANRGEVVQRFQSGAMPVFLISLKAGGVGLNLTGADTVVHFDPWWNPAVEDQATDRAHRIGQTRVVTSYKLISRGTVEEKILTLQQKKREIIRATLGEQEFVEALGWDEIQELFT